jgi:hypothetical protein
LIAFGFQRGTLGPLFQPAQYTLFRNLWIGLSALAFASGNFWIFVGGTLLALLAVRGRMTWPASIFPGLMLCLPAEGLDIPGFGLINFLFTLSVPRLFALLLLAPTALALLRSSARATQVRWPDRLFACHVLLQLALTYRSESLTSAMRAMFYVMVDVGLPYFVLSRAVVSTAAIRQALGAIVAASAVLATIAIVEFSKGWLLYQSLGTSWGLPDANSFYLMRDGLLRVRATAGHAIALGFVFATALSALLASNGSQGNRVVALVRTRPALLPRALDWRAGRHRGLPCNRAVSHQENLQSGLRSDCCLGACRPVTCRQPRHRYASFCRRDGPGDD